MHYITTVLVGLAVLAAFIIVPFLLGAPVALYARQRGYLPGHQVEDSWLFGALVILFFALAYTLGSIFV